MKNLPSIDIEVLIYILISLIIFLVLWLIHLERRISKLLAGKEAKSLEDTIFTIRDKVKDLELFRNQSISYFRNIERRLKRSIQAVETIRFNPFKGTGSGGNQSFSTTFIDEKGDGVVISTLHSRERISVFSKPIKNFSSQFEMTEEEKTVLGAARKNITPEKR